MRQATRRFTLAVISLSLSVLVAGGDARGGFVITIEQIGSDVVASASGSIDLTGLTALPTKLSTKAAIDPAVANLIMGSAPGSFNGVTVFAGVSGPTQFGSGSLSIPSSGTSSGAVMGIAGAGVGHLLLANYSSRGKW